MVLLDENGERYVTDKNGKRVYLKINENGQLYYTDENGVVYLINKKAKYRQKNVNFYYFKINQLLNKNSNRSKRSER